MKKLMNILPVLAFVLAAIAGMAFTSGDATLNEEYGFDGQDWYRVTGLVEGVDYDCDFSTEACIRDQPSLSGTVLKDGIFVPGDNMEPIE